MHDTPSRKVLGVGHCQVDASRIARVVTAAGGEYVNAGDEEEALALLRRQRFALVLPNRVIGSRQQGGLDLIRSIKADPRLAATRVMLVSGFKDKQEEAVTAGAEPGFGKAALESPEVRDRLREYLG